VDEILSRLAFDFKLNQELMIGLGLAGQFIWILNNLDPFLCVSSLVGILIRRLRLSPSQAIEAYMKLDAVMPKEPAKDDEERSRNSEAFKTAFLEVLNEGGFEADTPMADGNMPKMWVTSYLLWHLLNSARIVCTSNTANSSVVHPIWSYRTHSALSRSCTILQVSCRYIASMDTFDPVSIGFGHKRAVLTDAMAGCANLAKGLLREAQHLFGGDAEVATIVSIGAGKGNSRVLFKDGRDVGISEGLRRGIALCEQVHEDLQGRLEETSIYYWFNVEQELGIDPEVVLAHGSA
jgi:hypothetical protein